MKTLKNILFYSFVIFILAGYIGYEFSESCLSSPMVHEMLDTQTESESRDYDERTLAEEYAHRNSLELKSFYLIKQMQYCTPSHIVSFDFNPFVWTPPKHA